MSKPYRVTFDGIDGTSHFDASRLSAVARYLKARDLGPEYRRLGHLQGEYGQFFFRGFGWADVLDGSPLREGTAYKAELLAEPIILSWRERTCPTPFSAQGSRRSWVAKDSGEIAGEVVWMDHRPAEFFPAVGQSAIDYLAPCATLAEAKAAVHVAYTARERGSA